MLNNHEDRRLSEDFMLSLFSFENGLPLFIVEVYDKFGNYLIENCYPGVPFYRFYTFKTHKFGLSEF
jgi:hypothetical protein